MADANPIDLSISNLRDDQRRRWQAGDFAPVESYLARQPQLADNDELLLDFIYSEFCLAEELRRDPRPVDYLARFPRLRNQLRALFEVHRAVDDGRNAELASHGVTARLEEFDAAWRLGGPPDLQRFFRGDHADEMATRAPIDRRLAEELIMLDIEHRWKMSGTAAHRLVTGKAPLWANPRLEDYVEHYPELGSLELFSQKAVNWEYYVRHRWGDCPPHEEYLTRFPWLKESLERELPHIDQELAKEFSLRRPRRRRKKRVRARSKEVVNLKVAESLDGGLKPQGDVSTRPLPPPPGPASADRNMLWGILALQMDFINRDQLVAGMNAWVLDKAKPLSQLLLERGALTAQTHALLEELVTRHLELHGNDPARSLAAVRSPADVQQQLSSIADEDVQATMSFVASEVPAGTGLGGTATGAGSSHTAGGQTMTYSGAGLSASGGTRFRVLRPHAKGGLGEVFVALDTELHREVALKEIQPRFAKLLDQRARFAMEAEITGRLEHPGIVPVYGMGYYPDGRPYYTMRFIKGDSLKGAIDAYHKEAEKRDPGQRALEFRQLLRRFIDVCNAVAYAHSRGVLHRDLKPANVMLGPYGETLVVDWGLAKSNAMPDLLGDIDESVIRLSGESAGTAPTQMGSVIGTPQYMSPEQAQGKLDQLGPPSDVYSLGATFYVLLTGKAPFVDRDLGVLLQKVQRGEFPRPREVKRDVPKALEAVCLKAMAVSREQRYQTGREMAEDIEHWLADEPVSAYREPHWARLLRWARHHRAAVLSIAAVVFVSLVALGAWRLVEGRRLARLRADGRALLAQGQEALARDDLAEARLQLTNALTRVRDEAALDDLAQDTQRLLEQANARLAAQAEHEAARHKLEQFLVLRDKVLFHGTLFTGIDIPANLAATRDAAEKVLALFPVPEGQAPLAAWPDENHLTSDELQRVRHGLFEVLLVLADATAQVLPAEKPDPLKGAAALAVLERAKKLGVASRAWHLRRAKYLFQAGQDTAAERETRAAENVELADALDHFLVGDQAYQQDDLAGAIGHFEEALRLEPDHFWAHYFLAVCHLRQGQPREAIAHLTASLSRRPDFAWIYLLRGYAYGELNDFAAAEADFLKAASLGADDYGYYINRGAMRLRQGKLDSAQRDFEEAARRMPEQYQAYVNLAEVYRQRKQFDSALEELNKALRLAPRVSTPHRVRAQVFVEQEKYEEAVKEFFLAIEHDAPGSAALGEDLKNRGRVLHYLKRYREALADYDAAQAIRADDAELDRLRADTLLALGKGAEALAAFNRYIDPKPIDADALRQRAFERVRAGDAAGALADFTRAVELDPKSAVTRARRGWAYLNSPRLALEDFEAAIQLDPNNGDLYNGRGYAKALLGQYREAVADAEEALNRGAVGSALNERLGLLVNAACTYALASGKAAADPEDESQQLAPKFEARAIALVRQAAGLVRIEVRPAFLAQTLADPAFDLIRHKPAFRELQAGSSQGNK